MLNAENQKPTSIDVVSVATGRYINYWKQMILSADKHTKPQQRVKFIVFTDNLQEVDSLRRRIRNLEIESVPIQSYGWPEATLFRYAIFSNHMAIFKADLFVYVDADMLFHENPWDKVAKSLATHKVGLVAHPGFWRPTGMRRLRLYMNHPRLLVRDALLWIRNGGLGTWEKRPVSTAYVPRGLRKRYVCGGFWFGTRVGILKMIRELEENVRQDYTRGIIAKWHDESHLNQWASRNLFCFEDPQFCFDLSYVHLKGLKPIVQAVSK